MLVDWFTVAAQAINFLILVWLMKRYLYRPILHAIDEREKKIAAELADADAKRAEAKQERDEFKHKNDEFDQQRAALLSKATEEAATVRTRLLDDATKAADELATKRRDALETEQKDLSDEISRRTHLEVFALTRKTLGDLASVDLEKRMCDVFTDHLRSLNGEVRQELFAATENGKQSTRVRSAFELPTEQRSQIQSALNEMMSADVPIQFDAEPDLISGIELTVNGKKMAWSVKGSLEGAEAGVTNSP
ncbi:F0F1 ATP synthase subunit delta [Rhodopirellula baltica]|uniref:ATP synthase subunit b n=1 Tax=Rhodopirellula baltica WH47 TaxID=991778 RepID=F2AQ08_RHOBT|nr:F0F1 ATP synthase subunit delta [Rhodopirellula baltica]EGF28243.1 Alternate ATPase, F0 complex, subunit B [Rhodopirellula baltica WH47]